MNRLKIYESLKNVSQKFSNPLNDYTQDTINKMDDNTKRFSLSPKEIANSFSRANNNYEEELNKFGGQLDEVTEHLFSKAYEQLEYINTATKNEYDRERNYIDQDTATLANGDSKTYDISYTDVHGQEISEKIGVEKGYPNDKYFYLDESNPHGPQREYISESDFNDRLSTSIRNKVKAEHGIGEELYTLTADDGSKLVITDARDDSAKANSFKDGFKDINMYHIAPDGTKTQMTKDDVQALIQGNGVTKGDIDKGKTHKLSLSNMAKAAGKVAEHTKNTARTFSSVENKIDGYMGLNTQTRG